MSDEDFWTETDRLEECVSSPEDLYHFVGHLMKGYKAGMWEQQPVEEFLGGIMGCLHGMKGLCKNYGYEPPGEMDWPWVARILRIGLGHS